MTRLTSQSLLLGLIALMGGVSYAAFGTPMHETLLAGAALALIALSLGLERLFPLHEGWNESRDDTGGDIASFVLIFGLLDSALKWLGPFLVLALLPELQGPLALPFWAELIAVVLLIELGAWASHWAHHRYPRLWALHAMHHSPERLYTLNNFRFHPFNHILNYLIAFLPPLALGLSQEALLTYAALSLPILLLQHSNVRFDFGLLDYLFNTNALHRWHHSAAPGEGTKNLGRALVIWDHVFGTYFNPAAPAEPQEIGLFRSSKNFPAARYFLRQLAWPFSKACCT